MVISKYAYMSEVDPTFAPMKPTVDAQYSAFWGLEPEEFESAWKGLPTSLPEGTPDDLDITHEMVTVRDGAQIEIRVYRKKAAANGPRPIVLVAHGGGWILGNHDVEEGFSRWTATEADATVISVDYRLYFAKPKPSLENSANCDIRAPKFKFPYAINDFYDVFKWVSYLVLPFSTLTLSAEVIMQSGPLQFNSASKMLQP
jgi:acetyl esterase/lipase